MSNREPENYDADIISLLDDEGNEYEFEILDEIDYKDGHYYALMPLFDLLEEGIDSQNTYMIFEAVDGESGEPELAEVDDDELLDEIAEIFESGFDAAEDNDD